MKRNLLLLCLISLIGFAACAAPTPDQPSPTVEAPTATVATATPTSTATVQPTPTATITPTVTSMPTVAPDYVWLDGKDLMIYSHSGNLCMKDGDSNPIYLMPADSCEYKSKLYNDGQSIFLLSKEADPEEGCLSDRFSYSIYASYATRVWRIDRQTGTVTYLTSTYDLAEQLGIERLYPIWSFQKVPGSDFYVFNTAEAYEKVAFSYDLYLLDESGQVRTLLEPGDGAMSFELSPDGQYIAYQSRNDEETEPQRRLWIGLIDTNGENNRPRLVTYYWSVPVYEPDWIIRMVWNTDSDGFWFATRPPNIWEEDMDIPNIMTTWFVPVDGEPVNLGSIEHPSGFIRNVTFSPDGRYVAYVRQIEKELHIMRPDGSGDYVYFDDQVTNFSHWVDNTHFTFISCVSAGNETTCESKVYRGGIGEEPVLLESSYIWDRASVPAEGCAP